MFTVQQTRVTDNATGRTIALLHDADHDRVTITTPDTVPTVIATVADDVQTIHLAVTEYLS